MRLLVSALLLAVLVIGCAAKEEGLTVAQFEKLSDQESLRFGECQYLKLVERDGREEADRIVNSYAEDIEFGSTAPVKSFQERLITEEGISCTYEEAGIMPPEARKAEKEAHRILEEEGKLPTGSPMDTQPQTAATTVVEGNSPEDIAARFNQALSGTIGTEITPQDQGFSFRVLDVAETDRYVYTEEDMNYGANAGEYSKAGKFVVVTYSVRNISTTSIQPDLQASLIVAAGGREETYQDAQHHPAEMYGMDELAPRAMTASQFVFDVPADAKPLMLIGGIDTESFSTATAQASATAGARSPGTAAPMTEGMLADILGGIVLTEEETGAEGPSPEEILALSAELHNNELWEERYRLYAAETKAQMPLAVYKARLEEAGMAAIVDYSFPTVEVTGDTANVTWVYRFQTASDWEQRRDVQPLVRENGLGWRVILSPDQLAWYLG